MLTEVIMIINNQMKVTESALNSLYRNTDPDQFRLIAVDSGSDKEMKDFLKFYQTKAKNMEILLHDENIGWCKGLNAAYKKLKNDSDFVVWANNDILFERDWLPKMIAHFKGGVGAVGPTSNYVMGRQQAIFNGSHTEEEAPFLIGFCLMFRREVVSMVGDVDERFGIGGADEMDYIIRMKKDLGFSCVIARDVYIHHFGSKTLMPHVNNDINQYNDFCIKKDKILQEKWGSDVVSNFLSYPQKDLLMCVPRMEQVQGKFWKDTLMMWKPLNFQVVELKRPSNIAFSRNALIEFAKEGGWKRVLFCDTDMEVPPDAIYRLMQIKAPIKSGYFFAREYPHFPCALKMVKANGEDKFESVFSPNSGIVEVDAIGMAFTMIDMNIFDKLSKPWFHSDSDPNGMGEDIYFCCKVRKELGLKIIVDTDLIIRHTGEGKSIGPEDWIAHLKKEQVNPNNDQKEVVRA